MQLREKILATFQKTRRSSSQRLGSNYHSQPKRRIALAVMLGMALGVLLAMAFIYLLGWSELVEDRWLSGSALFTRQFEAVETFETPPAAGELSWNYDIPNTMVRISLRPQKPITAMLQFNPNEYQMSHFYQESWTGSGDVMVLPNSVTVRLPTANRYVFIMKSKGDLHSPMVFKLMTEDSLLVSKSLSIKGKI